MTTSLPGPEPIRNFFSALALARRLNRDFWQTLGAMFEAYGDTFALEMLGERIIITRSPQLMRETLVVHADAFSKDSTYTNKHTGLARFLGNGILTSDGDFWKRQRKLVAPALHARRIEAYAEAMTHYAERHIATWHDGAHHNIAHDMTTITFNIVSRTLFDYDGSSSAAHVGEAMEHIQHYLGENLLVAPPAWLPTPRERRARQSLRTLNEVVYGLIQERRAENRDRGDLLSMLLLAEDDDGQHMSDEQVRDEAVTLFLAGHETTANHLNWTFYLLAQNPAVEAQLHAELDRVLGGRTPTLADLKQLVYTERVVKESMRLYPPAFAYSRLAKRDVMLGDVAVQAGDVVQLMPYYMHRHPALWDDAERFDPERWSPEREEAYDRYQYLPFGGGPRVCIGNTFAMMEARLVLATIAQQWQLRLATDKPIAQGAYVTLNPIGGMPMTVHRRRPAHAAMPPITEAVLR